MKNKPQLLLPAGDIEGFKTALLYGADAVYCGISGLSLRTSCAFNIDEIREAAKIAKNCGKKLFLALNLFSRNSDMEPLNKILPIIKDIAPDGLIVADPGIFQLVKTQIPNLPLHISTQANICSSLTVDFWRKSGASLCILGREVSFKESVEIRRACPDIQLEIFIHGSMCISYSGRCLLSSFMASRGANRGLCAHSCRWKYRTRFLFEEELRAGEFLELIEDDRGSYILNSKDLCLLPKLNQILNVGFDSLKIEGRNKSHYYIAQTARVYRKAIDDYFDNPDAWNADRYMLEISALQNRGYTLGFFKGTPNESAQDYADTSSRSLWRSVGKVVGVKNNMLEIEVKNKIEVGESIEFLSPYQFEPIRIAVRELFDGFTGERILEISAGRVAQTALIPVENLERFPKLTAVRRFGV
ncbi:MAG: U32 family peptidase C-terminal domain-containing protein [Elusimicrobiota bacterium]|jgi:putative protease|nr:U32 family peptidase C-terminal domain-containing protein [Elusimicrobiota bacterium]